MLLTNLKFQLGILPLVYDNKGITYIFRKGLLCTIFFACYVFSFYFLKKNIREVNSVWYRKSQNYLICLIDIFYTCLN